MKSLPEILEIVCKHFNVTSEEVLSGRRDGDIPKAKKAFCYIARTINRPRVVDVGEFLGIRHDVVSHHANEMKSWVKIYPWWREICDNIEYEIISK